MDRCRRICMFLAILSLPVPAGARAQAADRGTISSLEDFADRPDPKAATATPSDLARALALAEWFQERGYYAPARAIALDLKQRTASLSPGDRARLKSLLAQVDKALETRAASLAARAAKPSDIGALMDRQAAEDYLRAGCAVAWTRAGYAESVACFQAALRVNASLAEARQAQEHVRFLVHELTLAADSPDQPPAASRDEDFAILIRRTEVLLAEDRLAAARDEWRHAYRAYREATLADSLRLIDLREQASRRFEGRRQALMGLVGKEVDEVKSGASAREDGPPFVEEYARLVSLRRHVTRLATEDFLRAGQFLAQDDAALPVAEEYLRKALALDPTLEDAKRALATVSERRKALAEAAIASASKTDASSPDSKGDPETAPAGPPPRPAPDPPKVRTPADAIALAQRFYEKGFHAAALDECEPLQGDDRSLTPDQQTHVKALVNQIERAAREGRDGALVREAEARLAESGKNSGMPAQSGPDGPNGLKARMDRRKAQEYFGAGTILLYEEKDYDRAVAYFVKSLRLNPSLREARKSLSVARALRGDKPRAGQGPLADPVLQHNFQQIRKCILAGGEFYRQDKLAEAVRECDRAAVYVAYLDAANRDGQGKFEEDLAYFEAITTLKSDLADLRELAAKQRTGARATRATD